MTGIVWSNTRGGYVRPLAFETGHRQRTENRAVSSFFTSTSIDRNPTKGVKPKQHSFPNFLGPPQRSGKTITIVFKNHGPIIKLCF